MHRYLLLQPLCLFHAKLIGPKSFDFFLFLISGFPVFLNSFFYLKWWAFFLMSFHINPLFLMDKIWLNALLWLAIKRFKFACNNLIQEKISNFDQPISYESGQNNIYCMLSLVRKLLLMNVMILRLLNIFQLNPQDSEKFMEKRAHPISYDNQHFK